MNHPEIHPIDPDQEEKILKRLDAILEIFTYLQETKRWNDGEVFMNKAILYTAIVSYFDDIRKCKDYSNLTIADRHKVAGYTVKWISKLKPIQTTDNNSSNRKIVINNFFALFCGLQFLNIDLDNIGFITPEYFDHLMYETQYRTISGRSYASKLYLLEKLIASGIEV